MFANNRCLAGLAAILPSALACLGWEGGVPVPTRTEHLSEPIRVRSGEVYDGQWALYDRSPSTCSDQSEGGEDDTAFVLEPGATLRNAIIGRNTGEGVYCVGGGCHFEFVWFEDVCEDAISIKEDPAGSETWIVGGGAYHASDKIIQHNGCGHVNIINFYAEDYGKVYRSCGGCDDCPRSVHMEGVTAVDGNEVVGINIGDSASLSNICSDHDPHCQLYDGPGDKVGEC